MAATHLVTGAGSIGGKAEIDSTGNSIANWAADGNGGLTLTMAGGNLSAVLVSLSGLEFGNAIVAALGLPQQTHVRCFVGDLDLRRGIVDTRTLMLDTGVAIVRGAGTVDLRDQRIDYRLSAKPKHITIGSIPTPIDITGTLRDPSIRPQAAPLLERGAAAVALGFVAPPLALLATIQLGVNDPHDCGDLVEEAKQEARSGIEGAPLAQDASQPGVPAQGGSDGELSIRCQGQGQRRRAGPQPGRTEPDCQTAAVTWSKPALVAVSLVMMAAVALLFDVSAGCWCRQPRHPRSC